MMFLQSLQRLTTLLTRPVILAGLLLVLAMSSPAEAGTLVGLGGKCADVELAMTDDGTPVVLFDCGSGANQQWQFESVAPFFRIRASPASACSPGASPV